MWLPTVTWGILLGLRFVFMPSSRRFNCSSGSERFAMLLAHLSAVVVWPVLNARLPLFGRLR